MPAAKRPLLDDFFEMLVFVRVVDSGSLSSAARSLGATASSISKRIASLEGKLRTTLLHRTTRRLAPTDAGRRFYEHAKRILGDIETAERELVGLGEELRGTIRVTAPVTFGHQHLAPLVADFLLEHAEVDVELTLDDRFVDVVGEDFDLAIRSGVLVDSSLVAKKLAPDPRVVCASPKYLAERGTPRTPADLTRHDCMRHAYNNASHSWSFEGPDGRVEVTVRGQLHVNHGGAIREAAIRGLGIAFLPFSVVADPIRAGTLSLVLEDYRLPASSLYAVSPSGAHPTKMVRALVDFLAAKLPERITPRRARSATRQE